MVYTTIHIQIMSRVRKPAVGGAMNDVQRRFMREITQKIHALPIAAPFRERVREEDAAGYYNVIHRPMWLNEVLSRIDRDQYTRLDDWRSDVNLIWKNAMRYNQKGDLFFEFAADLESIFKELSEKVPTTEAQAWAYKLEKVHKKMMTVLEQCPENL